MKRTFFLFECILLLLKSENSVFLWEMEVKNFLGRVVHGTNKFLGISFKNWSRTLRQSTTFHIIIVNSLRTLRNIGKSCFFNSCFITFLKRNSSKKPFILEKLLKCHVTQIYQFFGPSNPLIFTVFLEYRHKIPVPQSSM